MQKGGDPVKNGFECRLIAFAEGPEPMLMNWTA